MQTEKKDIIKVNKNFRKLNVTGGLIYEEIKKLGITSIGQGIGKNVNLDCDFYKTNDNRIVEVYGITQYGYPTFAFIEIKG